MEVGPPRKRARVQDDTNDPTARSPTRGPSDETVSGSMKTHEAAKDDKLKTIAKPVSPPPLKRPISIQAKPKPSASPRQTSTSTTTKKPPAKEIKKESLNPRLLKSAPASHQIRTKLLRLLHAEYTRLNSELKKDANDKEENLLLSDQQLITKALDEEQLAAVEKAAVYSNVLKNKVMQYKKMGVAKWKQEREQAIARQNPNFNSSDPPKEIKTGLTPAQEVQLLSRILTPIDKLSAHGYVPTIPTDKAIESAREGREASKGWEKCDRCQQRFQVFPGRRAEDGALTTGGSCKFHWGKAHIPTKQPGDTSRPPKRYQCCGEDVGESSGCFTRDNHVFKASDGNTLATTLNFAETPENAQVPKDRAVCFDCEMGYTVHGMELIRLTAVSWPAGEELLDALVRPLGEVLDLNSRYSGVWPEDMARAKPYFEAGGSAPSKSGAEESGSEEGEVKARNKNLKIVSSPEIARGLLFSLLDPSTPLIGHGLENDLNAVRMVHPTLVDTVLLYPHKAGLPFRYGLKMLMDHHLNRKIQVEHGNSVQGHDSAEDARAAGDLVRLKIAAEWGKMQRAGWKLVDGEFVAPGAPRGP